MIELEKLCVINHQFFREFNIKLPENEKLIGSLRDKSQVVETQEMLISQIERTKRPVLAEDMLLDIGKFYLAQHEFKLAAKVFEINTIQYPSAVKSWEGLGLAYSLMEDSSRALAYYNEALDLQPNNCRIQKIISSLSTQITGMNV